MCTRGPNLARSLHGADLGFLEVLSSRLPVACRSPSLPGGVALHRLLLDSLRCQMESPARPLGKAHCLLGGTPFHALPDCAGVLHAAHRRGARILSPCCPPQHIDGYKFAGGSFTLMPEAAGAADHLWADVTARHGWLAMGTSVACLAAVSGPTGAAAGAASRTAATGSRRMRAPARVGRCPTLPPPRNSSTQQRSPRW